MVKSFCIECGKPVYPGVNRCGSCYKTHLSITKEERKHKNKVVQKQWYENNKERLIIKSNLRTKSLSIDKRRDYILKNKYGITTVEVADLLKVANYKCMICITLFNLNDTYSRRFSIDHCHSTGKIRGVLCPSCNKGLGLFKDSVESLQNAIRYLKESYDKDN